VQVVTIAGQQNVRQLLLLLLLLQQHLLQLLWATPYK
jgi:hypothetical protein